ncbi:MAG: glutamate racemase [Rhodomicrobium sp.]
MSITARAPRLLFIDSGLGGLTVLRAARAAVPEADVLFIADDAGFPYGLKSEAVLVSRLLALIEPAVRKFTPDCIVLACNTASTIALQALRESFAVPIVGTVPAVKPAAALTRSGLVSVLATPATVAREYTRALILQFGAGANFTLVGAPSLAAIAEAHGSGAAVDEETIAREIAPAFIEDGGAKTDVVVLGCTHYPLLLDKLDAVAPWPVAWLDPAPAIGRRIANVLAEAGHIAGVGARHGRGEIQFTSGQSPSPTLRHLLHSHQLTLQAFEAAIAP